MAFHSLSVETACDIFMEANRTSPACLPDPSSIPLVVTAVCKWWRNVGIACQSLWTFYQIDGSSLLHNGPLYLARAGNAAIHVHALGRVSPPNREVYNMLTRHVVRRPPSHHTSPLTPLQGPMTVNIRDVWIRCPLQTHLAGLSINASAAAVLMHSISLDSNFFSTHAPLHQVTCLALAGVDTGLVARFIHLMPNIVHFTVVPATRFVVVEPFEVAPITMPHLVHLSLASSKRDWFYGAIVAPQLSVLKLDSGPLELQLVPFRKQISNLTYLSLSGPIHRLDLTFRNFLSTDSLTVLRLDLLPVVPGSDHPFDMLLLMRDHPDVLPNVRNIHTNTVWTRSALEVLRTLRQPRLRLSIFILCASGDQPIPGAARIQYLCEKGIVQVIRQCC